MTDSSTAIPGGERIGDFQIIGKLGAGGMGVVYKATDLRLERTVALKFLPAELNVEEKEKESLAREAKAASALDHANIGVIHGLEETAEGRLFIVMGYYEGETLAHKIRRGRLPLQESLDIACQVARGLCEAHARHIVHRDIKPSNIIITDRGVAKIVDFGLARVISSASSSQSMRTSGTAAYMSPEQAMGKALDHRTDVWSLGIVLVEMVTGCRPFGGENLTGMMWEILNKPPSSMDNLPPELQPIVYRALAKDPSQRYANCEEMLADLERVRKGLPADPRPERDVDVTASLRSPGFAEAVKNASQPSWSQSGVAVAQKKVHWWYVIVPLAVLVLAAGSLLIPSVRERAAGALTAGGEKHIAVLPFDNIGNNPANEPLAEGLMDSLAGKLSDLDVGGKSLWVVPTSEVRSRKISDPTSALRELGATLVVKGSISRDGQDVHLNVNLIDTKNLRQIGSASLEDRAGDLAALQDEAVSRLAKLMHINITADMLKNTGGAVTPAAYEGYLTALGLMQRYDKPGNLDQAIAALEGAVKADPRFALGYAQLGEAYRLKYKVDPNPKWMDEALANCQKAVELDDHVPAVYVTLARIHEATGKHDLGIQEFQHALTLNPRDADALGGMAGSYESAGRIAEAETTFKKAAALRPDFWDGYDELGNFYDRQGKYPEAIAQYRRAIELTPDNAQVYLNLGAAYIDAGDPKLFADAEQALKKSIELSPSYPAYANLGNLYAVEKHYPEAAAMTEKALQLNDKNYLVWNNLVVAYEWLKEEDKASAARERMRGLLEQAAKIHPQDAIVQSRLASLYAHQKLRDKAIARIQTALALAPDDPYVLANVGSAYEDIGDRRQALEYIRRALQKGYALDQVKNGPDLQGLIADPNFRTNGK
jgi:eukaryotic-like serine/threonine-protein kinase